MSDDDHGFVSYPAYSHEECQENSRYFVAFERKWDNDPYAIKRTAAMNWLGDKYACAKPERKKAS